MSITRLDYSLFSLCIGVSSYDSFFFFLLVFGLNY